MWNRLKQLLGREDDDADERDRPETHAADRRLYDGGGATEAAEAAARAAAANNFRPGG
jgi:hypothetical protein